MAGVGLAIPPFKKEKQFLDGLADASIEVSTGISAEVAKSLVRNDPFPPGTIRLGTVNTSVSGHTGDLKFGGADGPAISFRGSASGGGGIGVYATSLELLKDVAPEDSILDDAVLFPDAGTQRYLVLNWHYDVNGALNGAMALGQLSVKFGVEASSAGRFITIRRFAQDPPAQQAVQDLITAWRLPRQVHDINGLPPGVWIVAEVNGGIKTSIGASYGFKYNWIRSIQAQGLSGDIGLKIQAAAEVTLGFEVAGKYAVMVCRESLDPASQVIRVRVKKLAKKGWNFALHANVGVDVSTGKLLPQSMDDFVAGIFGVHGAQIVEDLKEVRRWTDPKTPLNTLAGDFVVDLAKKEFASVFGVDPKAAFEAAHQKVTGFLDAWLDPQLGHSASSLLWSAVREQKGLDQLEPALRAFASHDNASIRNLIRDALSTAEIAPGPVRNFLDAVVPAGALAAIDRIPDIDRIRAAATRALEILDGKVIDNLVGFIRDRLTITKIENLTFDQVDKRLKEKLSTFIGKTIDLSSFNSVRQTVHDVLAKADEIYKIGRDAVNKKYEADLLFTYQSVSTRTALLDLSFDFKSNPGLGAALQNAIQGDFVTDGLLHQKIPGVTIHEGLLTHGIKRQSSLEITLPHFSSQTGSITESLSALKVLPDGDRIALDSSNETFRKGRWSSRMALTMDFPAAARQNIRIFADQEELASAMSVTYGLRIAHKNFGSVQMERQLGPLIDTYFPGVFGDGKATVQEWVADFDKNGDAVENNGTGLIGNTLLSLDVSLPGRTLAAWWNAPLDGKDPAYRAMSINIQRALRKFLPYAYFSDLSRYAGQGFPGCAVMVYASLPVASSVRLNGSKIEFNTGKGFYWDFQNERPDGDLVLMLGNALTDANLNREMDNARVMLANTPSLHSHASFYVPGEFNDVKNAGTSGPGRHLLKNSILFIEAEVISGAVEAGKAIARFRQQKDDDSALEALDNFGAKLVETFNKRLGDLFDPKDAPELLRSFGLLVFVEAARALHPMLSKVTPAARLELRVLKSAAAFPPAGFPDMGGIKPEDVVIAQPIMSVA